MQHDDPCTLEVFPLKDGGLTVEVTVPTYEGGQKFALSVERDVDGDWRVIVPWPNELGPEPAIINGCEFFNGIGYLGSPDKS